MKLAAAIIGLLILPTGTEIAHSADVSVVDGNSIKLNGQTVRLWGIAAPSLDETCTTRGGKIWPCGKRARDQLSEAVREDDPSCQNKEAGFVQCRVSGIDVGLLLVKEGLARSTGPYAEIEERARSAKTGIWE